MRIVVTGASGRIGQALMARLVERHNLVALDRRLRPGVRFADLSRHRFSNPRNPIMRWHRWERHFKGADVVIHLAGNSSPVAPWPQLLRNNVKATWNTLEAAAAAQVPRFIYASSTWVVRQLEHQLAPDCYQPDGPKISSGAALSPLQSYASSKAFGEIMGKTFVAEGKLADFLAVRIGYAGELSGPGTMSKEERARWVGTQDLIDLIQQCITVQLRGFHTFYAVSGQSCSPFDLSYTSRALGWRPTQSSDAPECEEDKLRRSRPRRA